MQSWVWIAHSSADWSEIMIETERLLLREYTPDDYDALYEIVSDPETMAYYPAPFDEVRTRRWIEWNLENYAKYGFGLWAAVLKETGEFIRDCGLTLQNIDGEMLPEIGYHIHKKYWRQGFAKEAARAVRDWAFLNTKYHTLYSYMKYSNEASWRTALANGMKKVKEYDDPKNTISYAFAITRQEWEKMKKMNEDSFTISIRRITKGDFTAVALMWRDLLDILNASEEHVTKVYEQMFQDGCYCTFVADVNGKVVGFVTAVKVLAVGHPGGYVKMNGLCVLPEYRHRGIGRKLMTQIESWAVEQGAPYLGLASGLQRKDAHDFYAHLGYQKTSYWFRKKL